MSQIHRVLIVGVGSIGERHLRCFLATGRARTAIVEVNAELRSRIAGQYDVEHSYADLDSALAVAGAFDAAVVATPAPLHVPQATRLALAGMHVLIEKPLSTSMQGIDLLTQAIAQRRLIAAVAYVQRHQPVLIQMKRAIDEGRFGQPLELIAVAGQHFPFYRPAYARTYYAHRASGGGAIQDALTHIFNVGEWLVGPIDRLIADAAHLALEGTEVEDTVHVLARHGPVLACYVLNQHQAPNEITITVVCQRGTVRAELHENRWRWMTDPGGRWHDQPLEPIARDALFVAQANNFLDAVEGKATVACTLEQAVQTLRVNLAALRSAEQTVSCFVPVSG